MGVMIMQFFEANTAYNLFRKEYGYKDPRAFYKDVIAEAQRCKDGAGEPKFFFIPHINFRSLTMEACWYEKQMPYYKIWPGVFDTFVKTRLDIKAELLKYPHNAFVIKLPKTTEPLISFYYQGHLANIESIMVVGGFKEITAAGYTTLDLRAIYSCNNPEYPYPGSFHKIVSMPNDETIEQGIKIQAVSDFDLEGNHFSIPVEVIDACIRLTVATMFLATGSHKVLEFDVLAKHLNAYREMRETNAEKRKGYEDKAKQKGKFGWNIGSGRGDRGLKLPNGTSYAKACQDAGGRELLYQHVRGGHWHTVKYGKGRKEIKVVWFEETTVRKDLLPKPLNA
jgi:hypothetical protein